MKVQYTLRNYLTNNRWGGCNMEYEKSKHKVINKIEKCFQIIIKRVEMRINNRKIKVKIIYLYIFCVMIPVFVTNTFVIKNFMEVARHEEQQNIDNVVESASQYLISSIESALYLSYDLYSSYSINNFLDTSYKTIIDYLQQYKQIFNNYTFYASSKLIINSITLYSDNATMINGGSYYRIDSIQDEKWYQKFREIDGEMLVFPYYYNANNIEQRKRMISFIRKLNYLGRNDIEKIVKIDINYNKINEYVKNIAGDTLIYICHKDKILFTNDKNSKNVKEDYYENSMLDTNDIQLKKSYSFCDFDFDVYLKGYQSNYSDVLIDNLGGVIMLLFADAIIPAVVITLLSNSITNRVLLLGKYLNKVKEEVFEPMGELEGYDEIGELGRNYNLMVTRIKNLLEIEIESKLEQQELDIARQQAELLALRSQINPHFLFNVLESIRLQSVLKGEYETSHMMESLAKLMRKSAEWGSDLITIDQEVDFADAYLKLQKYRFGEGFNYKFKINKECSPYLVPSLAIVSFVENSCVHGLNREGHYGTIFISAYRKDSFINIEIEDTGVGMEEEQVKELEKNLNVADIDKLRNSSSLGMLNSCIRLKKYYGNGTKINIHSEKQVGTCIIIKIPIINDNQNT